MAPSAVPHDHQTVDQNVVPSMVRVGQLGACTADPPRSIGTSTLEELREICRALLDALDEEREAASASAIALGHGTRVEVMGSGSIYRFKAADQVDAATGDPVLIRTNTREVDGVVASCQAGTIELLLTDDIGRTVAPGAELLLEAPWLVSRLRGRISEAFEVGLNTQGLFNLSNALRTLGVGEIHVEATGLTPAYEDEQRPLNAEQRRAIATAFRSSLSLIASPGGTGKTLVIGALVEACFRAGLRTLVCAPSNVAVDLAMMQVCARLSKTPGFQSGSVLRAGSDAGPELRREYGPAVVLDDVLARVRPRLRSQLERMQMEVDTLARRLGAAQQEAGDLASPIVEELGRKLAASRVQLRERRQQMRDFARQLVGQARIVGATLARVFLDPYLHGFDVVIIDEASMAHLPAVFLAAGLARSHVVIAGDPFQLAAPVRSNGPNRRWLSEDVFSRLDVIRAIRDKEDVPYVTQLVEQRRSADAICELQRCVWYGPALRTAREVTLRERARHNVIFGTSALCYIDTAELMPRAYRPWRHSGTYANDEHAMVIRDLLVYMESAGEIPEGAVGEILILSHYRGQVWNVRRALRDWPRGRDVSVRTIHRSQGAESTTCILDLTLSRRQSTRASNILTAVTPFEDGSRLLAVACARPRSRLIVLGDLSWLEESVLPRSILGKVYSHLLEHGYGISLDEFLPRGWREQQRLIR